MTRNAGVPVVPASQRGILSVSIAISMALLLLLMPGATDGAVGQTTIQDGDCTFSVAASERGKNWWELSAACEFSGWDFIDAQGFGLRGSEPIAVPPECKKYGDQSFSGKQRRQSHVCGPAGLGFGDHNYLTGAARIKVNPKAPVPDGFSARTVEVRLFYSSHPGLHGAGGLAAYVEIKVPKKWVEPSPTPSESPEPSPTPSEPVPTASPSPTPDGPLLVLTKTVDPKKVPEAELGGPDVTATWTITVRNAGNAAYEGPLKIEDRLPDIWNLRPTAATVDGAMGFSNVGPFFDKAYLMTIVAGQNKGDPATAFTTSFADDDGCFLSLEMGKTIVGTESGEPTSTTVDAYNDQSLEQMYTSKKMSGSALIHCSGIGRIEPGEDVTIIVKANRPLGDGWGDLKVNIAQATWDGGTSTAKAVVELEGLHSVIDDVDAVVGLGSLPPPYLRAMGPGKGLIGTEVDDEFTGAGRSDVLMGHYGNDLLRGGGGSDILSGDVGSDDLYGGGARDGLIGGSGNDLLKGGDGNDLLVGGPDKDRLFGEAGNDRIEARDGERDVVNCGAGKDVAIVDGKDKVKGCEKVRRKG